MTNCRLSSSVARSLVSGVAALWLAACSDSGSSPSGAAGSSFGAGAAPGGGSPAAVNPGSGGAISTGGTVSSGIGGTTSKGGTGGAISTGGLASGGATTTGGVGTAGSSGGTSGAGGRGGAGGGGGMAGAAGACQKGQVAGNEVLIVGDSYFPAAGSEIPNELRRLSGANYRDVSVGGTKMAAIAMSYSRNRTPQPKVVIMDGGGNDILQNPGCAPGCAQEVQAVTDARNFLKQMATDGVKDVVFIFYYDMPSLKAGLDWMRPKMLAECQQSPVPCHFVDNQPLFAGKDASTYTTDGIHPNKQAADLIAKQVWDRMQMDCIAQ